MANTKKAFITEASKAYFRYKDWNIETETDEDGLEYMNRYGGAIELLTQGGYNDAKTKSLIVKNTYEKLAIHE
jgi:hypothetical protein